MEIMKKESKEITVAPKQDLSIEALMQTAVQSNVPVETLERLVALRTTMKAELAREAFNGAMATFQANCPAIQKTKAVHTKDGRLAYKYAPIESIVAQVKDALRDNGFSYSTNMELLKDGVKVSVKVTHTEGHSEVSEMQVPFGTKTQIMSDTQVVAAAQTFAKRYAFCNAFGILTGDEDTDAAPPKEKYDTSPPARKVTSTGDDLEGERVAQLEEKHVPDNPVAAYMEKKERTDAQKKSDIMKLCEAITLHPLEKTKESYENYIWTQTGFMLKPENYNAIIAQLTSIKAGEK